MAALEPLGIPERRGGQRHRFVDADEREIGVRIVADETGAQVLAVGRGDGDARPRTGRAGHMAVGEDKAVRRHHHAGARAAARVLWAAVPGQRGWGAHGKPDHSWADPIDHIDHRTRIGIEESLILGGYGKRRRGFGSGMISPQPRMQGYDFHRILPC